MEELESYDYHLPQKHIAQSLASPPESCKFLIIEKESWNMKDVIFSDILDEIDDSTLIVFNNSKVLKARILLPQGEIFYLRSYDEYTFEALVRPWKKFKVWDVIDFDDIISFEVSEITNDGRKLRCNVPILQVLEKYWKMPLPPYISYDDSKEEAYQPVFAKHEWSVAAPTASLHFSAWILASLYEKGIQSLYTTLHVWLWTFKPVTTEDITQYAIQAERMEVATTIFEDILQALLHQKKILAVWTTVTRPLESLPYLYVLLQHQQQNISTDPHRETICKDITLEQALQYVGDISITWWNIHFASTLFIYPWFTFRIIDQLITNFHLPKSSLLMLVAWFMWYEQMKTCYEHAIQHQYAFYSFGDAMWIR